MLASTFSANVTKADVIESKNTCLLYTSVDAFGQNKRKEWKEKIHSEEELKEKMNCQLAEQGKPFPFAD